MSVTTLVEQLQEIDDPRCAGKVGHRLGDILVIAVCAVIACAESWEDIALYGHSKRGWLESFLELPCGIPSHDTFRRVFMMIDPDRFEAAFLSWVRGLTQDFAREVVAIDGKTIRGSFDRGREQAPLHMVSAWASDQQLVLGQRCVDGKSNEITAIPVLLDALELKNSIITLDAMGCQTAIAARILDRCADYLLALKGNHGRAHKVGAGYCRCRPREGRSPIRTSACITPASGASKGSWKLPPRRSRRSASSSPLSNQVRRGRSSAALWSVRPRWLLMTTRRQARCAAP